MAKEPKGKTPGKKDAGSDRMKALDAFLNTTEKKYGGGTVFAGDAEEIFDIEPIPSGDYGLDMALGIGGIPRGRIVEIFGNESGGKTTLALSFARSVTKAGGNVLYVDAEHAMNMGFVEDMGIDLGRFYLNQPDYGEQGLDIVVDGVKSGAFDLIVVDSVSALTPKAELEGEMTDSQVGVQARMMGKAMRKIAGEASSKGTCIVFINQIREKVGVMFGSPETTSGGRALKFFASQRLDVRRIDTIKASGGSTDIVGIKSKVKVVKNKVAPPFRVAEISIVFGLNDEYGVSVTSSILTAAQELGIIEKSGSWYQENVTGQRVQGENGMKSLILSDPAVRRGMEDAIKVEMEARTSRKKKMEKGTVTDAAAALAADLADVGDDPYGDADGDFIKPEDIG